MLPYSNTTWWPSSSFPSSRSLTVIVDVRSPPTTPQHPTKLHNTPQHSHSHSHSLCWCSDADDGDSGFSTQSRSEGILRRFWYLQSDSRIVYRGDLRLFLCLPFRPLRIVVYQEHKLFNYCISVMAKQSKPTQLRWLPFWSGWSVCSSNMRGHVKGFPTTLVGSLRKRSKEKRFLGGWWRQQLLQ